MRKKDLILIKLKIIYVKNMSLNNKYIFKFKYI